MVNRINQLYSSYPKTYWTLMGAQLIDDTGGALLFPFFSLYVTQKFGVGMTQVGGLYVIFSAASIIGGMVGGTITDKFGRRLMIVFGLVASALSSVAMGLVDNLAAFFVLAGLVGLLADAAGPARQAMVADLLPPAQHTEGYGIQRIIHNLAVAIGPAVGGLLAAQSFLLLFLADAVTSIITAVVVYLALPETKPAPPAGQPEQNFRQMMAGYGQVFRDRVFIPFLLISILAIIVYAQMYSTLAVYLRDLHAIPAQGFGLIMTLNATMVVLFQYWISRRITKFAPMITMAVGSGLYAIGFGLYGFVSTFALFLLAMVIITLGEMVTVPVAQSLAAQLSPQEMRGRYMAVFGLGWAIPFALGPLLAGLIMDNADPNWVWYGSGILATLAGGGYLLLHLQVRGSLTASKAPTPQQP